MSAKILVVDDEAPIRTLLCSAVASPDIAVFDADSGRRALEIASREAPFELVVTDVLMPGMDGFELADELVRAGHAKAFLFISGYFDEEVMSARVEGFPGALFLSKPFGLPELLRAVRQVLDHANGGPVDFRHS